MTAQNVIALDFMGVMLTPDDQREQTPFGELRRPKPDRIDGLNKLAERATAAVIVVSDWREFRVNDDTQDILRHWGYRGAFHPDKVDTEGGHRGEQLARWQRRNPEARLVILDDRPDLYLPAQQGLLVPVNSEYGLSPVNITRAEVILLAKPQAPRPQPL